MLMSRPGLGRGAAFPQRTGAAGSLELGRAGAVGLWAAEVGHLAGRADGLARGGRLKSSWAEAAANVAARKPQGSRAGGARVSAAPGDVVQVLDVAGGHPSAAVFEFVPDVVAHDVLATDLASQSDRGARVEAAQGP